MLKLKNIKHVLCIFFVVPSYIIAFENGNAKLERDMVIWVQRSKCPYKSRFWQFVFLMCECKPFRNIVYYRIYVDQQRHFYFKWLFPEQKDIYILCDDIGGGFLISHGYGTVIYAKQIGENFHAYQGATLGMKNGEVPTIGDNVTVYAGAKIIGNVSIGNNVEIGANAVVLNDVPDDSIAVGIPARVILKQ